VRGAALGTRQWPPPTRQTVRRTPVSRGPPTPASTRRSRLRPRSCPRERTTTRSKRSGVERLRGSPTIGGTASPLRNVVQFVGLVGAVFRLERFTHHPPLPDLAHPLCAVNSLSGQSRDRATNGTAGSDERPRPEQGPQRHKSPPPSRYRPPPGRPHPMEHCTAVISIRGWPITRDDLWSPMMWCTLTNNP
jgi:hypothetical protein